MSVGLPFCDQHNFFGVFESQRDSIHQPRVARPDLPWVTRLHKAPARQARPKQFQPQPRKNGIGAGAVASPFRAQEFAIRKRQRAGALQNASRCRKSQKFAPASWTAAALRRFSRSAAVSETSRSTSIRREISVSATRHSFPTAATGAAHIIALLILIQFDNHTRFH